MATSKKRKSPSCELKNVKEKQALERHKAAIEFILQELGDKPEKIYEGSKYLQARNQAYRDVLKILTGENENE